MPNKSIAFGLVNVPVTLTPLDKSGGRSSAPGRNYVCAEHPEHGQLQTHRYCVSCDNTVEAKLMYPTEHGYVEVSDDEIKERLEEKTALIGIDVSTPASKIDPIFYRKHYLVRAKSGEEHTHDVLAVALRETGGALKGTVTISNKTEACVIRWSPATETLVADVVYFSTSLYLDRAQEAAQALAGRLAAKGKPKPAEVAMATQLIEAMSGEFDPEQVEDVYGPVVAELVQEKADALAGKPKRKTAAAAKKPDAVVDLMAALEASVTAAKKRPTKKTRTRKVAA